MKYCDVYSYMLCLCVLSQEKVHGAALSGIHATEELLHCGSGSDHEEDEDDEENEENEDVENTLPVVVIGAGAAGLFAATTAQAQAQALAGRFNGGRGRGRGRRVVVLEATERHGGRVHTVTLPPTTVPPPVPVPTVPPIPADTAATSTFTFTPGLSSLHHSESSAVGMSSTVTEESAGSVQVDLGASWLQQFPDNFLATRAQQMNLDLHPTDFQAALCAASDGIPVQDLHRVVEDLCDVAVERVNVSEETVSQGDTCTISPPSSSSSSATDMSIIDALRTHISALPLTQQREAHLALAGDINSDFGYYLHDTSAKYALLELGVGNEDHCITQGYGAILDPIAQDLDIRYKCPVQNIAWHPEERECVVGEDEEASHQKGGCVTITLYSGEVIVASHCICTVPVALLQGTSPVLSFTPPLPRPHLRALRHIHQGKCEKVVLRFSTRWWPHSPNGLYRWYDNAKKQEASDGSPIHDKVFSEGGSEARGGGGGGGERRGEEGDFHPLQLDWNEWLDLTDCVGAPVVVGFCVGEEACARFHGEEKSDAEIAAAAARAFEAWAWYRMQSDIIELI